MVQEHPSKDIEREIMADDEAEDLEEAREQKLDAEDTADQYDGYHSNHEAEKLEAGAFQPHAYPHINFEEEPESVSKANGSTSHSNGKKDEDQPVYRTFGRGGAGRRASTKSQITSEAAELARAEAASWAQMAPLIAATLGPLSVMLGIPTLTQRWRGMVLDPPVLENGASNYQALPDPPLNLALAGVSLFCEIAGNALLVLRFSNFHTKITTYVSYAFWMAKIVLGLANYIQFGINYPETDDIIYLEGFWVPSRFSIIFL